MTTVEPPLPLPLAIVTPWARVDHYADIYALGALSYELLTEQQPFVDRA